MAMLKTTGEFGQINGQMGGTVYRFDQCGQHAQAQSPYRRIKPTDRQKRQRRAFSYLIHKYLKQITPENAWLWQNYANHHPHTNKKGETIILTWWNMFLKVNIPRYVDGKEILLTPPS